MLELLNLDTETRSFMRAEVLDDTQARRIHLDPRLSEVGQREFPGLLLAAVESHNEIWLAEKLRQHGCVTPFELVLGGGGMPTVQDVPVNAAERIAEEAFNRYYARGLCCRATHEGIPHLVVYQATGDDTARPDVATLRGMTFPPGTLLECLRSRPTVDAAFGIPEGPSSGLSLCLP
jgi:hypothetical protein